MRSIPVRVPIVFVVLAACQTAPLNGTTASGSVIGKSFNFNGYYDEPGQLISLQVLREPQLDPDNHGSWVQFATTTTSTEGVDIHSDALLYPWEVDAAPVPANATATQKKRWPQGGLARIRAMHAASGDLLATFDAVTYGPCAGEHYGAGDSWQEIGQACQGLGEYNAMLVSTSNIPEPPSGTLGYLGRKGIGSVSATLDYYLSIDAPTTLTAFKQRYGITATDPSAIYYNDGDLGLGREMHCTEFPAPLGTGVACYVTNYAARDSSGNPIFGGSVSTALGDATNHQNPVATVAMTYRPDGTIDGYVDFMAYNASGALLNEVALDSTGNNKSIPQNCLACHGINSSFSNGPLFGDAKTTGGRFLPFDVFSFKYTSAGIYTYESQANKFRQLNALVRKTQPTAATIEMIDGMYAPLGVNNVNADATNDFVPADWNTDATLDGTAIYRGLVKVACRTCHVSAATGSLDFADRSDFVTHAAAIRSDLCDGHLMPHAERVMKKFWESGARAYTITGLPATSFPDALAACKP